MSRWLIPLVLALAGLVLSIYIVPFHDHIIELQPDGKNLGTISASDFRVAAFVLGGLPLGLLSVIVGISRRFRLWASPWIAVTSSFLIGIGIWRLLWQSSRSRDHKLNPEIS